MLDSEVFDDDAVFEMFDDAAAVVAASVVDVEVGVEILANKVFLRSPPIKLLNDLLKFRFIKFCLGSPPFYRKSNTVIIKRK